MLSSAWLAACAPARDTATPASFSSAPDVIPSLGPAERDDNPYGPAFEPTPPGHHLLAIDPELGPYKVNLPARYANALPIAVPVDICVSATGAVTKVELLEPSLPIVDQQLPIVIPRWRYHPYVIEGRAVPWCYRMRYEIGDPQRPAAFGPAASPATASGSQRSDGVASPTPSSSRLSSDFKGPCPPAPLHPSWPRDDYPRCRSASRAHAASRAAPR